MKDEEGKVKKESKKKKTKKNWNKKHENAKSSNISNVVGQQWKNKKMKRKCGDSIPNLCKVPCSQCAHKSTSVAKCFQCSSVVDLSRQPFSPKETRVCLELSSASCYRKWRTIAKSLKISKVLSSHAKSSTISRVCRCCWTFFRLPCIAVFLCCAVRCVVSRCALCSVVRCRVVQYRLFCLYCLALRRVVVQSAPRGVDQQKKSKHKRKTTQLETTLREIHSRLVFLETGNVCVSFFCVLSYVPFLLLSFPFHCLFFLSCIY